jgi:hypothetical protein
MGQDEDQLRPDVVITQLGRHMSEDDARALFERCVVDAGSPNLTSAQDWMKVADQMCMRQGLINVIGRTLRVRALRLGAQFTRLPAHRASAPMTIEIPDGLAIPLAKGDSGFDCVLCSSHRTELGRAVRKPMTVLLTKETGLGVMQCVCGVGYKLRLRSH